ncbi:MAG: PilT/PilU family type 4a pilus ATPase [Gammaproteobacteria bacterium]|jgi:twitching motility protein PilU|nr:PilT/PilU family type 4a pilus ATPase [Gammaproteobacteria bacterium]MBT3859582.1 PilT/PilU family type 4a pilus ATPase [Gammaproteobacteria bacterium]MBT3986524.1 PilT/PilU family type 4a pilus ATPase [Gammaproteobacteria bacterium]MBT4256247.1 PilT/PilU family type 4a pilus ATPase [Gammaproteobacteria bacterium]MBT4581132.1 PilT/PilU family type 4a pilus ATPase [Gammaproteobacteria bacterium]
MGFKDLLKMMIEKDGSDLFLTTGAAPSMKAFGNLTPLVDKIMPEGMVKKIAYQIMNEDQIRDFEKSPEMNLAISDPDIGRFRVNIFQQRGEVAIVARNIKTEIPSAASLGLPPVLNDLIMQKRGLVLFVGGTGSGKSTSLAALIDHRNKNSDGHIITIEDPVEFVHPHQKSIVNQREIGVDTNSYEEALQNTLRQAPDVILIGEIRSRETMEHALAFAETGHLCLSTLHANNANQALDRIINFFPEERHKQLFLDLSLNLQGFVSQRLIPTVDGKRAAAIEILLGTPRVCDLIKQGEVMELKEVMEKSEQQGMKTFDSALYALYKTGKISYEEALKNADSKNNLRLRIQLADNAEGNDSELDEEDDSGGLSLVSDDDDSNNLR